MSLNESNKENCSEINQLADAQLQQVRSKLSLLTQLESEVTRITSGCTNDELGECYVIESLAKHELCAGEH